MSLCRAGICPVSVRQAAHLDVKNTGVYGPSIIWFKNCFLGPKISLRNDLLIHDSNFHPTVFSSPICGFIASDWPSFAKTT